MVAQVTMFKETVYMDTETGEVVDTHQEAIVWFNSGRTVQVKYRYRFDDNDWLDWQGGPTWEH